MSHLWSLILLAPLLVQQDEIAAEAMKGYKHPWADFGDSSSVTMKETIRQPDINASGQLVYKDVTTEVTWSVVAATGEKTTFKVVGGGQESLLPYFIQPPNWSRGTGQRKGTEEITVGGVKRTCQVTVISFDANKDAGQLTTISKSADVPYWAVRRRVETLLQGKPNTLEEELVLDVDQKVKVGDRELACVLVQVTIEAVGGAKTVRKEWRTSEIPGGVARRETKGYLNGKELDSSASQMEVVRFQAKR